MKLKIYIPQLDSIGFEEYLSFVDKGSAIVSNGEPLGDELGSIDCYLESNRYGAINLETFADKAICAAGRLVERYPTVARSALPKGMLLEVGTVDSETYEAYIDPAKESLIARWSQ